MGRMSRIGQRPLRGPDLDRLRRPQVALVLHLRRHHRARRAAGSSSRASTSASSSRAASSTRSPCRPPRRTQANVDKLSTAVAETGIPAASAPIVPTSPASPSGSRPSTCPTTSRRQVTTVIARTRRGQRRQGDLAPTTSGRAGARRSAQRAATGLGGLPRAGGAVHLGLLPRVEDVGRGDRRAGPRHRDHRRRLRALRVRGHTCHDHRSADHPGLLALRHRRRLRQGAREHQEPQAEPQDLRRAGEPGHQPDPGAVDQHLVRGPAPGGDDPRTSASPPSGPATSRTSRSPCSSAWRPVPTPRSSSPPRSPYS